MRVSWILWLSLIAACSAPLPELVPTAPPSLSSLDLRGQYETGVEGTIATLPLVGARVELIGVGLVTHTDTNGEFGFLGIPVEALSNRLEFLVFDAQGMESDPPIGRFVEEISSTAVGSVTFTKKVVNPRGAVSGRVDLVGDENNGGVLVYAEGLPGVDDLTGPDGSFVLLGVPAGTVQIRSNRDGFLPTPEVVNFEAQAYLRLPVDEPIVMNPVPGQPATAATGGRVVTADGEIPEGTEVWAIPQISGNSDQSMVTMPVAANGHFSAALHFNEPHQFVLKSGGRLTAARRLHVEPGRQDILLVGLPLAEGNEDRDGDGYSGADDVDDTDPHTWSDLDGDGLGDIHDWDDDGDQMADMEELCPGRDNTTSDPQRSDTEEATTPVRGDVQLLLGSNGDFWGDHGASVETPTESVQAGFEAQLAERQSAYGTRLLSGPFLLKPSERGSFEFRRYGYLGSPEDRIELVTLPILGCEEWSEPDCGAPFQQFNMSAARAGITQVSGELLPAGRGRLKMEIPFQLQRPALAWVWLPGGAATTPLCGNGRVDPGELCDDGNTQEDDDCTTVCRSPVCGDGIMQPGREEGCDDGNGTQADGCTNLCQPARCGDGIVRLDRAPGAPGYEACDDGNNRPGDGCDEACAVEENQECTDNDGDGFGQGCPDGPDCNDGDPSVQEGCGCGDGVVDRLAGEGCDDGNQMDGDGCSSDCQVEQAQHCVDPDGDSYGDGCPNGPDCNEENAEQHADCNQCGNGFVEANEACDDGNQVGGDGCDPNCQSESSCGDGQIAADEFCDDGNTRNGDGCAGDCSSPSLIPLAVAGSYSCRVGDGSQPGRLSCWGRLLSDPDGDATHAPTVRSDFNVHQIALGNHHGCMISAHGGQNGAVYCFGENDERQLGVSAISGETLQGPLFPAGIEDHLVASKVATGASHSCALTPDGLVYCWGANDEGQSGQFDADGAPTGSTVFVPTAVPLEAEAVDLALGHRHSCATMQNGDLKCWGYAATNALGRWNDVEDPCEGALDRGIGSVLGLPDTPIHMISAGMDTTCALMTDGELYCWGENRRGELGQGDANLCPTNPQPTRVERMELIEHFSYVSAGNAVTCAIGLIEGNDGNDVFCWGSNQNGRLGINNQDPNHVAWTPSRVGGLVRPDTPASVAAGLGEHVCTLASGGTLCWGAGDSYQLGDCSTNNVFAPVGVQIACGL